MTKPNIQIFILSRDRPEYLREAVAAAINQKRGDFNFEVIVSDNSETDAVEHLMLKEFSNVKYIRRYPALNVETHFKKVISEIESEYIVLFHDDDILMPEYCESILNTFKRNTDAVAVGCNAYVMIGNTITNKAQRFKCENLDTIFNSEFEFLKKYLLSYVTGVAPFPSYMYKKSSLHVDDWNFSDGGKYSDASFLSKKIKFGSVIWVNKKLMISRQHGGNDGSIVNIRDIRSLWVYMKKNGIGNKNKNLRMYRYLYWKEWLLQTGAVQSKSLFINPRGWREKIVANFLLEFEIKKSYRPFFWRLLLGRIITKLWYRNR